MKRLRVSGVVFVAAVLAIASMESMSFGQAVSQISGTVKDQAGAVMPGVEITATQTDTGIARTALSNETGNYVLPNLAIGPYKLEAVYRCAARSQPGECQRRAVCRKYGPLGSFRYTALCRDDLESGAEGQARNEYECELDMVALHRILPGL